MSFNRPFKQPPESDALSAKEVVAVRALLHYLRDNPATPEYPRLRQALREHDREEAVRAAQALGIPMPAAGAPQKAPPTNAELMPWNLSWYGEDTHPGEPLAPLSAEQYRELWEKLIVYDLPLTKSESRELLGASKLISVRITDSPTPQPD